MTTLFAHPAQAIPALILIASSLGVIMVRKPVHASISFLLALFSLASLYLQLSAEFIAVMQILVYAGAILVIFMYIIVLFQDAYLKIDLFKSQSYSPFLVGSAALFLLTFIFLAKGFMGLSPSANPLPDGFGSVQLLGKVLYVDFFFPFEAVIVLFLIAVVGAVYTARKGY